MNTRPVVQAPRDTLCGFRYQGQGCKAGVSTTDTGPGPREAVHVLTMSLPVAPSGTALCGYHSPYDVQRGVSLAKSQPGTYSKGSDLNTGTLRQYPCHTGGLYENDPCTFASFLGILTK